MPNNTLKMLLIIAAALVGIYAALTVKGKIKKTAEPTVALQENQVIWKGMLKEPRRVLTPVWVSENVYFKIANAPVYVKVSNIDAGKGTWATVEIKYLDGKSRVFEKINKGEKKLFGGNKYSLELLDLKSGLASATWTRGRSAKITLYEN